MNWNDYRLAIEDSNGNVTVVWEDYYKRQDGEMVAIEPPVQPRESNRQKLDRAGVTESDVEDLLEGVVALSDFPSPSKRENLNRKGPQ